MFAKLFGTRASRRIGRERRFRPELERLHDRVLPSGILPMDNGGGHGHGGGNGGDDGGDDKGPPPGHQGPPPGHIGNPAGGGTTITTINNTIINSFNTINSGNSINFMMQLNIGQLNVLVIDEAMLALNSTFASLGPAFGLNPGLFQSNINALQNAISQNPMEHNPFGQLFGALAFEAGRGGLGSSPAML